MKTIIQRQARVTQLADLHPIIESPGEPFDFSAYQAATEPTERTITLWEKLTAIFAIYFASCLFVGAVLTFFPLWFVPVGALVVTEIIVHSHLLSRE